MSQARPVKNKPSVVLSAEFRKPHVAASNKGNFQYIALEGPGPFSPSMKHRDDLNAIPPYPIWCDVGCSRDHQFARMGTWRTCRLPRLTERIQIGPWPFPLPFSQNRQPGLLQRTMRFSKEPGKTVEGSGIC